MRLFVRSSGDASAGAKTCANSRPLSAPEKSPDSSTDQPADARRLRGLLALTRSAKRNDSAMHNVSPGWRDHPVQLKHQPASSLYMPRCVDVHEFDERGRAL